MMPVLHHRSTDVRNKKKLLPRPAKKFSARDQTELWSAIAHLQERVLCTIVDEVLEYIWHVFSIAPDYFLLNKLGPGWLRSDIRETVANSVSMDFQLHFIIRKTKGIGKPLTALSFSFVRWNSIIRGGYQLDCLSSNWKTLNQILVCGECDIASKALQLSCTLFYEQRAGPRCELVILNDSEWNF